MMSHIFAADERADAVRRVESGESLRDVAASIGSTPATIQKWVIAARWWAVPIDISDPDRLVDIVTAARILGVDVETLSRWSDRARLPGDRLEWRWADFGTPAWRVRDLLEFRRRRSRQEDSQHA